MDAETKRAIETLAITLAQCKAVADAFAGEYIDVLDYDLMTTMIRADREPFESLFNVMDSLLFKAYTQAKELAA